MLGHKSFTVRVRVAHQLICTFNGKHTHVVLARVVVDQLPNRILHLTDGVRSVREHTHVVQRVLVEKIVHKVKVLWHLKKIVWQRWIVRIPHLGLVWCVLRNCNVKVCTPSFVLAVQDTTIRDCQVKERPNKVCKVDRDVCSVRQLNSIVASSPSGR